MRLLELAACLPHQSFGLQTQNAGTAHAVPGRVLAFHMCASSQAALVTLLTEGLGPVWPSFHTIACAGGMASADRTAPPEPSQQRPGQAQLVRSNSGAALVWEVMRGIWPVMLALLLAGLVMVSRHLLPAMSPLGCKGRCGG